MSNYSIQTFTDRYDIYEATEQSTNSWFRLCPERGGIVISYGNKGTELLYLDKETFYDPDANIRGGIPVLFPISGQLSGGTYEWQGKSYAMKNHGVARNASWKVVETDTSDGAAITLGLSSDESTIASFPFAFELRFTYRLKEGRLTVEQQYWNRSDAEAMPMYPGFHPYFAAEHTDVAYKTDASSYYDYNDGEVKPYDGGPLEMSAKVESVVFLDASRSEIAFSPATGYSIRMTYGKDFRYVVLWGVKGKPFLCVEPWMARTDELNRKEELVYVQPGGVMKTFLTIDVESR
ncbi:aldose epimerase [Paenibacillus allorhizosphaerae]|uniref:Aldose epimerase n=1 Tax=Paenibacillus allorhizosphaerae TaxID=2849866 RepID=A0ABM8VDM1_9BACL|nr:aldose epimerase [Paenibacillus allorhizosphaerae]CAG7628050.1 hypothetical protein PAECIP111802_01416 [Paenibacillus allorhizosphaerae]